MKIDTSLSFLLIFFFKKEKGEFYNRVLISLQSASAWNILQFMQPMIPNRFPTPGLTEVMDQRIKCTMKIPDIMQVACKQRKSRHLVVFIFVMK